MISKKNNLKWRLPLIQAILFSVFMCSTYVSAQVVKRDALTALKPPSKLQNGDTIMIIRPIGFVNSAGKPPDGRDEIESGCS